SSSLCDAISTSPGFDCNVIALAFFSVAPPLRLGRFQLSRLARERTVDSLMPRRRAASRAPSSMASTLTASQSTEGLVFGFVVFFCICFSLLLCFLFMLSSYVFCFPFPVYRQEIGN